MRPGGAFGFQVAGQPEQVSVYFEGDADAALLVIGDDLKTVVGNDDAAAGANINPLVTPAKPAAGVCAVCVGRLAPALSAAADADVKGRGYPVPSVAFGWASSWNRTQRRQTICLTGAKCGRIRH